MNHNLKKDLYYYNSFVEYFIANGAPKEVWFEYLFIKHHTRPFIWPIPNLLQFVLDNEPEVLIVGPCEITITPPDSFHVTPANYHYTLIEERGWAFSVMKTNLGVWMCNAGYKKLLPGDEITFNEYLKPQEKEKGGIDKFFNMLKNKAGFK
jgi:hypothetical protein